MAWARLLREYGLTPDEFLALNVAQAFALFLAVNQFLAEDMIASASAVKAAFMEGGDWQQLLDSTLRD